MATPTSWWQTVPGILTGVAAFLTALTGLLIALNQIGLLPKPSSPSAVAELRREPPASGNARPSGSDAAGQGVTTAVRGGETSSARPGSGAAPGGGAASTADVAPFTLVPSMTRVRFGVLEYRLLDLRVEPETPQMMALTITVRLTSQQGYGVNFWSDTFRLLVDDVPRAPNNNLNKVVAGNSADEGEVRFVFPADAKSLALQIFNREESAVIALEREYR